MLKRFVVAALAAGLTLFVGPQLASAKGGGGGPGASRSGGAHHSDSKGDPDGRTGGSHDSDHPGGGRDRHNHDGHDDSYRYYGYPYDYGGYGYGGGYGRRCPDGQSYYGRGYCADPHYGDSPHDEGVWDCGSDPDRDHNRYRQACRYYSECTAYPRCKD